MKYSLSILIPTFNRSRQLSRILESLVAQELPESVQVVVSDNASSDDTRKMLLAFSESNRLPTLKCLFQEENLGPLANWKSCLAAASSNYVHWHWSDDHVDVGFYSVALSHLEQTDTVVLFPARYAQETDEGVQSLGFLYSPSPRDEKADPRQLLHYKLGRHRLPVSPLAYILPYKPCERVLIESDVEDRFGIGINEFATGYDELMILEALLSARAVLIETSKSVYMMRHDESISIMESGKGNQIRYAYARLAWCKDRRFLSFGALFDFGRLILFGHFRALLGVLIGDLYRRRI